jgi:hypothetical protein
MREGRIFAEGGYSSDEEYYFLHKNLLLSILRRNLQHQLSVESCVFYFPSSFAECSLRERARRVM